MKSLCLTRCVSTLVLSSRNFSVDLKGLYGSALPTVNDRKWKSPVTKRKPLAIINPLVPDVY